VLPNQNYFMKIFLSSESNLRDINKEFQRVFPLLKLKFYRHSHEQGESSVLDALISNREALKNISDLVPAYINIDPMDTVAEVEKRFQDRFGLPVQIFRRAGDVWVETVQTDDLTLQKQHCMGTVEPRIGFNIHTLFL
jgi:hypothetical protein